MAEEHAALIRKTVEETEVQIDDYADTIFAIIGFASLYFFDSQTRNLRDYVRPFQGRHLERLSADNESAGLDRFIVQPDLGIAVGDDYGIVAEVKKNFPRDNERAASIFTQLKRYDCDLKGWPTRGGKLPCHEIVLLVHLTTSVLAREFYETVLPNLGMTFARQFSIVEFTRLSQRQEYINFRLVLGLVHQIATDKDLKYGIPVPMQALVSEISRFKLYDAKPPTAYLLKLIWEHVITPRAAVDPKFERLRKDSKLDVFLSVDDITKELREGFSFYPWHKHYSERQPEVPEKGWVEDACKFVVESSEGKWVVDGATLTVFYRKYDDIARHFIEACAAAKVQKELAPKMPGFEGV